MQKPLEGITQKQCESLIRLGCYTAGEELSIKKSRYLIVLAVPYGKRDGVEDIPEAIEAFARLLRDDDYQERSIMVLDSKDGSVVEYTLEDLYAKD